MKPIEITINNNLDQELWADIFEGLNMQAHGFTAEKFIEDPWGSLVAAGQDSAFECLENGFKPLLPKQAAAAKRIQEEWARQDAKAIIQKGHLRLVHSR